MVWKQLSNQAFHAVCYVLTRSLPLESEPTVHRERAAGHLHRRSVIRNAAWLRTHGIVPYSRGSQLEEIVAQALSCGYVD